MANLKQQTEQQDELQIENIAPNEEIENQETVNEYEDEADIEESEFPDIGDDDLETDIPELEETKREKKPNFNNCKYSASLIVAGINEVLPEAVAMAVNKGIEMRAGGNILQQLQKNGVSNDILLRVEETLISMNADIKNASKLTKEEINEFERLLGDIFVKYGWDIAPSKFKEEFDLLVFLFKTGKQRARDMTKAIEYNMKNIENVVTQSLHTQMSDMGFFKILGLLIKSKFKRKKKLKKVKTETKQ